MYVCLLKYGGYEHIKFPERNHANVGIAAK